MQPSNRNRVKKDASVKEFRRNSKRTKAPNVAPAPERGGFRL